MMGKEEGVECGGGGAREMRSLNKDKCRTSARCCSAEKDEP